MSKKMKVLMIGSLLLNVLFVGIIIGDMSHRFRTSPPVAKTAGDLVSQFPEKKAAFISKALEKVRLENRDTHKQIRKARERAMKIMVAEHFDADAYQTQVKKIHALRGLLKQRLADMTMELAMQFNHQERKVLAQYLRRPPRSPWDHKETRGLREPRRKIP
jgi:uncharacterized membrane protein